MSRPRRFGHDYIYGIEHFEHFPSQYDRLAHRFKLADVDWFEFCGYPRCSRPHTMIEMFKDTLRGQDLADKGVSVTRQLARGVNAYAYVMAYLTERPRAVQDEIDKLNARVIELTRAWPITRFRAQLLEPYRGKIITCTPNEWWELMAIRHSDHHETCGEAQRSADELASPAWLARARERQRRTGLWVPTQEPLWEAS